MNKLRFGAIPGELLKSVQEEAMSAFGFVAQKKTDMTCLAAFRSLLDNPMLEYSGEERRNGLLGFYNSFGS